ncbi:MAG: type IV secretory system conjugative DNA transfer family protein, partial [Methylococcales bacterium]
EVHREKAIPGFAADFLLTLDDEQDAFGAAMKASPSFYAKQAYLAFRQAPYQTRGSILIGLYNKLRPFILAPARMITNYPTPDEAERGCRLIDFRELRKPGTAIYLVVAEGAADMYKEFIATFLGQAVLEMRLDGVNEPKYPCFVLIDEAYQLNVAEVKRISGIGRGRGVGLGLGYQDLPQMYDQYGKEQANAILGTVMTKIFLPGLDDVTAEYASRQLGDTTIFAKTYQDFPGKKNDNIRYAEQKRSLMHAGEIRQIAAHKELLIVSDTAPPIKAAYPPIAVTPLKFQTPNYGLPRLTHLGDVDPAYRLGEPTESENDTSMIGRERDADSLRARHDVDLQNMVSGVVDSVLTDTVWQSGLEAHDVQGDDEPLEEGEDIASRISSDSIGSILTSQTSEPVVLSKTIESRTDDNSDTSTKSLTNALNNLTEDLRVSLQAQYDRSIRDMGRSLI